MSDLFQHLSVYDEVPTAHLAAHVPYDPGFTGVRRAEAR